MEKFIKKGTILPRWLPNATYAYGSPVFTFMWGVPYYLGAFLHIFGLSYQQVFKILILLPNILSGLGFYLWIKKKYGRFIAGVSSIVFILTPYRFLDSFIRNALGELFFFAFLPFVFLYLDRAEFKKDIIMGSFFTALMIYSHQGLSLIGYPILIIYIFSQHIPKVLYLKSSPLRSASAQLKEDKRKLLFKNQILILAGGLLLTFFYWFPILSYHHLLPIKEGKIKSIWFPPLFSLIRSKWEGGSIFDGRRLIMSFQIGLGQLGIIFLSHLYLFYSITKRKRLTPSPRGSTSAHPRGVTIYWLSLFWLSIFFMQPVSKWFWINIPLIINLQFPFRLLFIPMFTSAILCALILFQTKKPLRFLLGFLFVIAVIIANRNHLRVQNKEIEFGKFTSYQGSYDVGGESLPKYVKVADIKESFEKNNLGSEFTIIKGVGKIISQERKDYVSTAEIEMEKKGEVKLRRIYFPGWQIYLNGVKTENFKKGNGIFLTLPKGKSIIEAEYKDSLLITFSNTVSILSFLISASFILYKFYTFARYKSLLSAVNLYYLFLQYKNFS